MPDGLTSLELNIPSDGSTTVTTPETYNLDRFTMNIAPDGSVSRSYTNNTIGHFAATENVFSNGDVVSRTDAGTQMFMGGPLDEAVIGNYCGDFRGHHSTSIDGLMETRASTELRVITSEEIYHRSYQELADDLQTKIVSARSQSEQEPDLSLVQAVKELLKPAPNLLDCIKQPEAEKLQDAEDEVTPPSLLENIYTMMGNYLTKVGTFIGACSLDTLSEMAKIQKDYMKDKAKKCVEAKEKMFEKLPDMSKESFKEGIGEKLFPDGEFSFESLMNIADMVTNPLSLVSLFISPSTEKVPKKQNFDPQQYQKTAAEDVDKIINMERNIS